jgi:ABC-2 type transport system permease protein
MSSLAMMVRRQLRVNRTSMIVMAILWTVNNIVQTTAYSSIFPNPSGRAATLATFTSNGALRALYGYPFDISNPTGWLAWRSLGFVVVVMAMWAAFITVGALRGEEDTGRGELALSQPQSRRMWFSAALVAVAIETLVIGVVNVVGLTVFCVTSGLMTVVDTLEVGLQMVLPALLFAAVGAVMSQLISTARAARIACAALLLVAFFTRTGADAGVGITWLRWATPLGWFEELHPPAAPSPFAIIAIVLACLLLLLAALRMLAARDIGRGLLPQRESRRPRRFLLGAAWQAALRDNLPQLSMWLVGGLLTMLLMGSLAKTLLDLVKSNSTFSGLFGQDFALNAYLAAAFSLVQLFITLLAVTMVVGARGEEASGRLELLVAEPLSRSRWLLSRAALAAGAAFALAVLSALALWAGAMSTGQSAGVGSLLEAALNCIPLIFVSVGAAVALLAVAPRAVAFAYAPVAVAYLWEALGTAFKVPAWTLDVSPFHWLATVPAQGFAVFPAAVLAAIGVALLSAATMVFRRRDLAIG